MEIQQNSRQIPKTQQICSNKLYYDILYAYLQQISKKEGEIRYLYKKDVNFSKLAKELKVSRQTLSKRFKNFQNENIKLIEEIEGADKFKINELKKEEAALVEFKLLKLLTDTLTENSISVYVYLLNRYYANNCESFVFKLNDVKKMIGISENSRNNNDLITNILFVLQKIGLIRYSMQALPQEDSFSNIKTIYKLEWLTNNYKEVIEC